MLRMMFPPVFQRSSVRFVALGDGKANPILRFYSTVETSTAAGHQMRRECSSMAKAGGKRERLLQGAAAAFAFILDRCQESRSKLSGGNHKFSDARLKAPIFNQSLTISGQIINQLESSKIGEGWCQTLSSNVNR
ncbi:MAG: hypothetical protein WAR76_25875 [Xanthobacteraceae bacterium]|jgi:hypothetical protein